MGQHHEDWGRGRGKAPLSFIWKHEVMRDACQSSSDSSFTFMMSLRNPCWMTRRSRIQGSSHVTRFVCSEKVRSADGSQPAPAQFRVWKLCVFLQFLRTKHDPEKPGSTEHLGRSSNDQQEMVRFPLLFGWSPQQKEGKPPSGSCF